MELFLKLVDRKTVDERSFHVFKEGRLFNLSVLDF